MRVAIVKEGTVRTPVRLVGFVASMFALICLGAVASYAEDVGWPDVEGDPDNGKVAEVVGIDYGQEQYSGATMVWKTRSRCTDTRSFYVNYVGDDWSDRASSAEGFAGCNAYKHFDYAYLSGARIVCDPKCPFMGAMNNETNSEKWVHD